MSQEQQASQGKQVAEAMAFLQNEARSSAADAFDLVGRHSSSLSLNVFQGKVQQTEISESVGIGIRVFHNGAPGYASTERLTPESLRQTLKDALSHCAFTEPLKVVLPEPSALVEAPSQWNADLEALSLAQMAEFSLALEAAAYARSSEIENIPHLGYGLSEDRSWFANSRGISYQERENSYGVGIGAVALRNGVRKMGTYQKTGRVHQDAVVATMAQIAVERSLELLDARPIAGCELPVVFSNRVSGSIIGMFLSNLHAESVQKGQSRFAGQLGKIVASPLFNLISDPFRWDLPGASVLDSEGVPTQRIELIAEGGLRSFLHNLETAGREGCAPTGNGSRGYSGRVGTTFHNCIVPPGTQSEDELLHMFPRCLHIVKLDGSSGCSAISGEISIGVQGFLYENGVCVQAVDGITISTNFFEMLKQIVAISSEYNDSFSSVKIPAFAVERVSVSG